MFPQAPFRCWYDFSSRNRDPTRQEGGDETRAQRRRQLDALFRDETAQRSTEDLIRELRRVAEGIREVQEAAEFDWETH